MWKKNQSNKQIRIMGTLLYATGVFQEKMKAISSYDNNNF